MGWLEGVRITVEKIEEYLRQLEQQGKRGSTLDSYQRTLYLWYKWLPDDKALTPDALELWKKELKRRNMTEGTIDGRVSVLKRFLAYLEDPGRVEQKRYNRKEPIPPERVLSREEYRMLLHTARRMGRRRSYLLIKTIVCVGLRPREFHELTVESLRKGTARVTSHGLCHVVEVPEPIRTELLEYAGDQDIREGPVFITKDKTPMLHSAIWKEVKMVCRQMGISEEKGSPKSLYKLYVDTQKDFYAGSMEEAARGYRSLLEAEEAVIRWN